MSSNDSIIKKIAEALLMDYTSVYYVNAVTNAYQWYSTDADFHSLHLEPEGKDFFQDLVRDADRVVYEEDKHLFMEGMQKERLLAGMRKGTMQSIEYRLMIDGQPVWHALRLIRGAGVDSDYFILGVLNIDKRKKSLEEKAIFNEIADSLAEHYDTLYYVDVETSHYVEFCSLDNYKKLGIPTSGEDFWKESQRNIQRIVYPDDRETVMKLHTKAYNLSNMQGKRSFSMNYRLVFNNEPVYYRYTEFQTADGKHLIIGVENIDAEMRAQQALEDNRRKVVTFGQIAESLASHYDIIYYVNSQDGEYVGFTTNALYGNLEIQEKGVDFFAESAENAKKIIHPEDYDRLVNILGRDYLISALENRRQFSIDYRMIIGDKTQFTRMTVMWSSDQVHFIIGVENVDKEVEKEQEQIQALKVANEKARRDELTGTKNKNAYQEFEASVQQNIDNGVDYLPFALVVCDLNNLKLINDTQGHKAGDDYIRSACRLICETFSHSPIFRIGGDEFVAFLGSGDYYDREALLARLRSRVADHVNRQDGPVIATGISVFDPQSDKKVSDVFERADAMMYEDKMRLKSLAASKSFKKIAAPEEKEYPEERRKKLDSLFAALALAAEGSYVFLCDMRYNYSRFSKTAVDAFGLPSEYMYHAADVWESCIHEDDRKPYREGIRDIYMNQSSGLDMQYRAKRITGEYDLCTARGIVLRDGNGEPEYFCGTMRNHGVQGNIDELTGLRNLYGFFEDLQTKMLRQVPMRISLIGIGRFSEINEVYGYHFGNRVLQRFGRYLFEHVGNTGNVYRLDGTKFAIISYLRTSEQIMQKYAELRTHFREGFKLDEKFIILDLNAGMLNVDHFNVDYQTVYACLNYAYGESKLRRQGDLVEFYNDLSDENKHQIERLYAIRASIMQEYHGFHLLYQPVVDAFEEHLIGAEALLRWKNEEYGMVPPDSFIPVLEKDPLFCDLGHWILHTALRDAKRIMEKNPDFTINVNLSYTQLEKPDFVNMVLDTLKAEEFPPEHLCLEITERCRLLDMDLLKNIVVNLRGWGVKIALDDFGTGFSSIGIVKNLPFDIIKIDRSFVQKIEEDEKERELIKSFAGVASTFGAKVCVEGIETAEMRDILQHYHVQSFQGYYYAKPLPLAEFLQWKPQNASS